MNLHSKLHKNSILTGPIESYCLVCGCLLWSEEESYAHINEPSHAEKLSAVPRLADYNDCIIKSKDGYFCRYCNVILPTIKRVSLHVEERTHGDNRNSQSITRHSGVILAFDAVIINERSWNGLDGSTCSVCNEDYDDEEDHKRGTNHVLNLIQIKCEFGETFIYRKVDEVLFFCLICNEILPILEKPTHHTSEKHLKFYEKSKTEGTAFQRDAAVESNNSTVASIEPNNNYITLPASQTKNIHILDTKEAKDNKPKTQENKVQNIEDNRGTNQKNTRDLAILNTRKETSKVNTEIVHSKVSKSDSEDKKIGQELENKPKPPLNSPVPKELKNSEAKVETAKKETTKPGPIPPVNSEVNGTAQIQEDNAEPYFYELLKAQNFVIKAHDDSAYCTLCDIRISKSETQMHCLDSHHSILHAKHIARKTSQLTKNANGKDHNTVNKSSETNGTLKAKDKRTVVDKENAPPVNLQANVKEDAKTNDKPVEAKGKVVTKDSKGTESTASIKQTKTQEVPLSQEKPERLESKPVTEVKTTVTENKTKPADSEPKEVARTDKENTVPNKVNDTQILRSSPEQNKTEMKPGSTETTAPTKKASKKSQKKAVKTKSAGTEATVLAKEIHEASTELPKVSGLDTNEANTEEIRNVTKATPEVPIEDSNIESVDYKLKSEKGYSQTDKAEVAACEPDLKTEKLLNLLNTVSQVDSTPDDVVINSKCVLGNLSFVMIVRTDDTAECVACDEELTIDDIHNHIATEEHRSNVEECLVVTSLDDEFIRQMKSQKYHCGYCNMLLPSWDATKSHLDSYQHSDAKTSASWRMERYRPHLKHCETREVRSVLTTIFRCTRE